MIHFSSSRTARIMSADWSMSQSAYTSPVVWIDELARLRNGPTPRNGPKPVKPAIY
jgi:hypothetical protein